MQGNIIGKERFCEILDEIRDRSDAARRYDFMLQEDPLFSGTRDFFSFHCLTGPGSDTVVELLSAMFGDENGDIEYFCYEIDYGRGWTPGMYTMPVDGEVRDIDISDSGKLYDLLTGSPCTHELRKEVL